MLLVLAACSRQTDGGEAATGAARTAVTLTRAVRGGIRSDLELTAVTVYQRKQTVAAPVSGFVTASGVQPGTAVRAGQSLFTLETREQQALGGGTAQPIAVRAGRGGIVIESLAQPGSYVAEGAPLCTLAEAGSMVFELNVPYEDLRLARPGRRCTLELPDGTRYSATLIRPLVTMDAAAQTQKVVARARTPFLPEGLRVKALLAGPSAGAGGWLLPKAAVQGDETLEHRWVMRMRGAAEAERVDVEVVAEDASRVEVRTAALRPDDRIIATGGYGLEDGSLVTVTK